MEVSQDIREAKSLQLLLFSVYVVSDVILRGKRMIDILPEFPLLEEISLSFKNQKHFDSSFYDKYPKLRTLKGQQLLLFSKGEIMMAQGVTRLELSTLLLRKGHRWKGSQWTNTWFCSEISPTTRTSSPS